MTDQKPAGGQPAEDPTVQLGRFIGTIRAGLAGRGVEESGPMGGYAWSWSQRGVWTVRAGSILEPGVEVTGPAGAWKCPPASLLAADLVLTLLQLADALPPVRFAGGGTVYAAGDVDDGMPLPPAWRRPDVTFPPQGGYVGLR